MARSSYPSQNPFTVDPGNDYSTGLAGLSDTLSSLRKDKILQAEQQRKQAEDDRVNQRFTEVQAAAEKAINSKNPDEVAALSTKYHEIAPWLKASAGLKDDMQTRDALDFTRAFATTNPANRSALYEQRIKAIQDRGGDPSHTIQSYQDYMQDPESETRDVMSYWAGIDPKGYGAYSDEQKANQAAKSEKDKAAREEAQFNRAESGRNARASARNAATGAAAGGLGKPTAHMQDFKQYQALKESDPEAAKAFGQAAGFVSKEGRELSAGLQARLAKTIDSAVAAENSIGRFNNLADDIEKSDLGGGLLAGSWNEKAKEILGSQNDVTELRKQFAQVRASQASANLPPGAASDADVALALGPIPSDNANKKILASYLRGQAKLSKINADFHNFKADYISETGSERGMLQAWKNQGKSGANKPGAAPASKPATSDGWEIVN